MNRCGNTRLLNTKVIFKKSYIRNRCYTFNTLMILVRQWSSVFSQKDCKEEKSNGLKHFSLRWDHPSKNILVPIHFDLWFIYFFYIFFFFHGNIWLPHSTSRGMRADLVKDYASRSGRDSMTNTRQGRKRMVSQDEITGKQHLP